MLNNIMNFANYWWFRYLMVTELYVVEKWERVTIHVIFMVLFLCVLVLQLLSVAFANWQYLWIYAHRRYFAHCVSWSRRQGHITNHDAIVN